MSRRSGRDNQPSSLPPMLLDGGRRSREDAIVRDFIDSAASAGRRDTGWWKSTGDPVVQQFRANQQADRQRALAEKLVAAEREAALAEFAARLAGASSRSAPEGMAVEAGIQHPYVHRTQPADSLGARASQVSENSSLGQSSFGNAARATGHRAAHKAGMQPPRTVQLSDTTVVVGVDGKVRTEARRETGALNTMERVFDPLNNRWSYEPRDGSLEQSGGNAAVTTSAPVQSAPDTRAEMRGLYISGGQGGVEMAISQAEAAVAAERAAEILREEGRTTPASSKTHDGNTVFGQEGTPNKPSRVRSWVTSILTHKP